MNNENTNNPENIKKKRNLRWYMRYLHNKLGFFIAGLVIIYAFSGLVQTYRDTDLLKHDVSHNIQIEPQLKEADLGPKLKLRNLKVEKTEGSILHFKEGTYNAATGAASYVTKEWYSWIVPFTDLHKTASKSAAHYFTTVFGFVMLFMSVSAFWMFKPGTKLFSSGVILTALGIVAAVIMIFLH